MSNQVIRCDCGSTLKEGNALFEGMVIQSMVCEKCGFQTLHKAQAISLQRTLRS